MNQRVPRVGAVAFAFLSLAGSVPALAQPILQDLASTQVAAGGRHTCAVTTGGGVKCWGWNQYGQLGDGTMVNRTTAVDVVGLSSGVASIAAGWDHTCAVTTGGGVKCWGENSNGQLGDGTTIDRTAAVNVVGLSSGVASIAAGESHTCALTTGGGVKCWGGNRNGQLGDGTTIERTAAVNVVGLSSGVASITAGYAHTCALTTGGGAKCWGDNSYGELGDGTTISKATAVDVVGLSSGVASITAGDHTCAVTTAGGLKCWGTNFFGQLGDGTRIDRTTAVDVPGLSSGVASIAAGRFHTCALTTGGGVKCWGQNYSGELGDGTTIGSTTAVDVVGLSSGLASITAGGWAFFGFSHTCALTTGGGAKCWGGNGDGQLGDGTTIDRTTAVDVVGLTGGATTYYATNITQTTATLNSYVNPNGADTLAFFEYGPTSSYGTQVAATPTPGSGSVVVPVRASITDLTCSTTYNARLVATSAAGVTNGGNATFTTSVCSPAITSFTASSILVNPFAPVTLTWSVTSEASITLNGFGVAGPAGSQVVTPGSTTTYTLVATGAGGSTSRTVTVNINDGALALAAPAITAPSANQTVVVTGVGFNWTAVSGATGYDIRVVKLSSGETVFSGSLLGATSTSTLVSLPPGTYGFIVRACSGGFAASQCGGYGTVSITVAPAGPSGAPTVTFPTQSAALTSSTQTLSWTAVTPNPALSGLTYEVLLKDLAAGTTALQITVPSPTLSTIFTMRGSSQYELKVRACQASCGPWSTAVTFSLTLPPVPTVAPTITDCTVSGGTSLTCNWGAVSNADAYQIQVVQPPPAGPGGGALTVAARQVSATTVTLPVPPGAATVFIAACNGDGCGPNATASILATGANPTQPNIGTPMAGTVVSGPGVLFTWNRIPGDTGTNTTYRLFVQDLSRQATALDVYTTNNFYSAYFKAEGARYDAVVTAHPGLVTAVTGPSQGFNVSGASATAPTMVSPGHNSTLGSGNIQLGWSPIPGATLYEYFVAVLGQGSASARGVTPGLLAQVPLTGAGAGTVYSGIVRACPAGATCVSGSDAGWGPWSNTPGGPGVTNFTVVP